MHTSTDLIDTCVFIVGSKLDKDQPYCESYGEFTQCMQNTIGDFAEKAVGLNNFIFNGSSRN